MNPNETFTIKYPAVHPGAARTDIKFFSDSMDLSALFPESEAARRIFVTDSTVAALPCMESFMRRWGTARDMRNGFTAARGKDALIVLGAGESYKTIESVLLIVRLAIDENMTRSAVFTAVGGGVICDMTAFAASMFKRGARVEFVPTTLLAMVDAAVGGKSGCDFLNYKNMIGSFWPAQRLYYFPEFVRSLPNEQFRSGLAEALKTAYLYSKDLLAVFRGRRTDILARDSAVLRQIISVCARAKARVVEEDFTEQSVRAHLNLGHTFAHALESASGLGAVSHGDAVAWGMGRAAVMSRNLGLCGDAYTDGMLELLREYEWETGAIHTAMASYTPEEASQLLLEAMRKDKKNTDDSVRCILQADAEQTAIYNVAPRDILLVLNPASAAKAR